MLKWINDKNRVTNRLTNIKDFWRCFILYFKIIKTPSKKIIFRKNKKSLKSDKNLRVSPVCFKICTE